MSKSFGSLVLYADVTLNGDAGVVISTNVGVLQARSGTLSEAINPEAWETLDVHLYITEHSGKDYLSVYFTYADSEQQFYWTDYLLGTDVTRLDIRFFMVNKGLFIVVNGVEVTNYIFDDVYYPSQNQVTIWADCEYDDSITVHSARRLEISDYRDAVYVDYEASAQAAIDSIRQQRPIYSFSEESGGISYTYSATKNDVDIYKVHRYQHEAIEPSHAASDGIVYSADVSISENSETAEKLGLIVRLFRLSELDYGAVEAAGKMQEREIQSMDRIAFLARLDPRLEIGDVAILSLEVSGTGTHIDERVIVEDVYISVANAVSTMTVTGRRQ